jgi:hypothetical protein
MTQQEHHADPEFIARLEGQLTTEYRRLERLGDSHSWRSGLSRWLRAALYVLSGLLLGAASVTMGQRAEDAERLELLQRQASLQVSLAEREVELNRMVLDDVQGQVAAGRLVPTAMLSAQAALVASEARLRLLNLDAEEINARRGPVQNEISAPRVDGRDFFSERLQLGLDVISARNPSLDEVIRLAEVRVQAGTAPSESLRPLTTERARLNAEAERIRETLALRQSFLNGDIDAVAAEQRHRLLLATTRRRSAESQLAELRTANTALQERYAAGIAPQTEVVAMQREILQAEAEVQMAEIEVQLIERELVPQAR